MSGINVDKVCCQWISRLFASTGIIDLVLSQQSVCCTRAVRPRLLFSSGVLGNLLPHSVDPTLIVLSIRQYIQSFRVQVWSNGLSSMTSGFVARRPHWHIVLHRVYVSRSETIGQVVLDKKFVSACDTPGSASYSWHTATHMLRQHQRYFSIDIAACGGTLPTEDWTCRY